MPDFDVEAFVAKLESLGVKLTAVPLADGRMRINRWRMPHAVDASQIESLWASQIGQNQGRIDVLAAHLAPASAKVIGNGGKPTPNQRTDRPDAPIPSARPLRRYRRVRQSLPVARLTLIHPTDRARLPSFRL
jgi:hypothetical protein